MSGSRAVAIITGASGAIGGALARAFAGNGHELVLLDRDEEELASLAEEILAVGLPRPACLALDLTRPDFLTVLCAFMAEHNVEPAFIVNSAGIGVLGDIANLPPDDQLQTVDVNVKALTELSLAFVDSLERHRGGILNVGSMAGYLPGPGMTVYFASKAYVRSFTEALHRELSARNVRVTLLNPGVIRSKFLASVGVDDSKIPDFFLTSAEQVAHAGYRGLMRGQRVVVPGLVYKALAGIFRLLPRGVLLSLMHANHRRLNRPRFRPLA